MESTTKRNAFQFRRANEEDLPEICRIVKLAGESVPVKEWFEAEDEEFLAKHIREEGFTLLAKKNGVLERNGHTEATVDLMKLAGLKECGLCCEIMRDDGTMMRTIELIELAKKWDLKFITIKLS